MGCGESSLDVPDGSSSSPRRANPAGSAISPHLEHIHPHQGGGADVALGPTSAISNPLALPTSMSRRPSMRHTLESDDSVCRDDDLYELDFESDVRRHGWHDHRSAAAEGSSSRRLVIAHDQPSSGHRVAARSPVPGQGFASPTYTQDMLDAMSRRSSIMFGASAASMASSRASSIAPSLIACRGDGSFGSHTTSNSLAASPAYQRDGPLDAASGSYQPLVVKQLETSASAGFIMLQPPTHPSLAPTVDTALADDEPHDVLSASDPSMTVL